MGGSIRHCQYHGVINGSYIRITSAGQLKREARERERDGTDAAWRTCRYGWGRIDIPRERMDDFTWTTMEFMQALHTVYIRRFKSIGGTISPNVVKRGAKGTSALRSGSCASLEAEG